MRTPLTEEQRGVYAVRRRALCAALAQIKASAVAHAAGMRSGTLSMLRTGRKNITPRRWCRLGAALGVLGVNLTEDS